jgi:hypothetical protein
MPRFFFGACEGRDCWSPWALVLAALLVWMTWEVINLGIDNNLSVAIVDGISATDDIVAAASWHIVSIIVRRLFSLHASNKLHDRGCDQANQANDCYNKFFFHKSLQN